MTNSLSVEGNITAATSSDGASLLTVFTNPDQYYLNELILVKYNKDLSELYSIPISEFRAPAGCTDLIIDEFGSIIIAGYFRQILELSIDDQIIRNPDSDFSVFLLKLDKDKEFVWHQSWHQHEIFMMGEYNYDHNVSLASDNEGNIYAAGNYNEEINFNSSSQTLQIRSEYLLYNTYLLKFDPSGQILWLKSFNAKFGDFAVSGDSVYFCCTHSKFNTIGAADTHSTIIQASLYNLNTDGDILWSTDWVDNYVYRNHYSDITADSMAVDNHGNILVAGLFDENIDIRTENGKENIVSVKPTYYLAAFNQIGEVEYFRVWEGDYTANTPLDIITDMEGYIYIIGNFNRTFDLDPGENSQILTGGEEYRGFITVLDIDGEFVSGRSFDIPLSEIEIADDGKLYLIGSSIETDYEVPGSTIYLLE